MVNIIHQTEFNLVNNSDFLSISMTEETNSTDDIRFFDDVERSNKSKFILVNLSFRVQEPFR